jgi:hypothetical protein
MSMSDMVCTYGGDRDQMLVAYLYDDISAAERTAFEQHVRTCSVCRRELEELGAVRGELACWTPPAVASLTGYANGASPLGAGSMGVLPGGRRDATPVEAAASSDAHAAYGGSGTSRWLAMPVWAQAAAAMLCVGVAAGLANLHITYNDAGLSVSTGWMAPAAAAPAAASRPVASIPTAAAAEMVRPSTGPVATQADLAALEQSLRQEVNAIRTASATGPTRVVGDEETMQNVRALVRQSEQRQQRELALRVGEVARDVQAQRQADLLRIDRTLGLLQSNTGMAVRRQEQLLNSLAVRVSQRQ